MAPCSGIRADGGRCEAQAIRDSSHCVNHHPDYAEARKRRARKGGKRGVAVPLQSLRGYRSDSRKLADMVLSGEVERGVGAVVGQLLNGARACVRDILTAREQEELEARIAALEDDKATSGERWGA